MGTLEDSAGTEENSTENRPHSLQSKCASCHRQGHADSKSLLQQNFVVLAGDASCPVE